MTDLFKSDALLSRSDILEKVREYARWGAEMEALRKKREEAREWFYLVAKLIGKEAARELIGDLAEPEVREPAKTARPRPGGVTWTGVVEDYVRTANRPVPYSELREAIAKTVLGAKLEKTDKSFYGAIDKLREKGTVVRKDGHVFSVDAFAEYERKLAAGEIEKVRHVRSPRSRGGGGTIHHAPVSDAILEFVLSHPEGVTGRDIINHMITDDRFKDAVERNTTSVYNPLARLVGRKKIRKEGTSYFPPTKNENSGSDDGAAA